MAGRRKASAVLKEFTSIIDGLITLDALNQQRYRAGPGRPGPAVLSRGQMCLITEGIFVRAFTSYESFLEELFILYACGKPTISGKQLKRYISPKDGKHAREIIKSGMNFLEWNSPDILIQRSETYLNGGPVKQAITLHKARLEVIRKVRNAIAHRSDEAWVRYTKIVGNELRAPPLSMPEPGEFLLMSDPSAPTQYFLLTYLLILKNVAVVAAG